MTDLISVTVNDGKYTIQQTAMGRWEALRYGEHWPAMASGPDNLHVALATEIARLRAGLEFYANPKNYINTPSWDDDPECITPDAIPVDHSQEGSPCDCGDRARAILAGAL